MAYGETNALLSAFYSDNPTSAYGTSDQQKIDDWGKAHGHSKEDIQIAQTQFLSDIVSGRKPKLEYEQIDFFVGPLLSLIKESDKPDASIAFKQAVTNLRQDPQLKAEMIRMQSRAIYENADVMMNYYNRFIGMKLNIQNMQAIKAANPGLTDEMYQKALTSITNMSAIYENKYASLSQTQKALFDKLLKNQKYYSRENQMLLSLPDDQKAGNPNIIQAEEALTEAEYKDAVKLMSSFSLFEERDVHLLVDSMSLYQCLMAADLLKKEPKENQFAMATFSELFQAPMRHPMLLEGLVKAADKVKMTTLGGPNAIVDDATFAASKEGLNQTKEMVMKANYDFGDNFMLDGSSVNEFLVLQKAAKDTKLSKEQKSLIDKIANVLQEFRDANNQYYLNPSAANTAAFKTAFEKMHTLNAELSRRDNQALLNSIALNNDLLAKVYSETKKDPAEVVANALNTLNEGALLYIRKNDFDNYRGQQISALILSEARFNRYPNDGELNKLRSDFKKLVGELYAANPQTDNDKKDFFKKVTQAREVISSIETRSKAVQKVNKEQGIEEKILSSISAQEMEDYKPLTSKVAQEPQEGVAEPKPSEKTYGDVTIDFKVASKEERRSVKQLLRGNNSQFFAEAKIPANFKMVETKKGLGIKSGWVVKDEKGMNVLYIVVEKNNLQIRELTNSTLANDEKLKLMHHITQKLKAPKIQPTVTSTDMDKVRNLNEISVNENQITYVQATDQKKALHKKIELESAPDTVSKTVPVIKIQCAGNTPDQIKDKFQAVVADGSFVPQLEFQKNIPAPILNFKINITSEAPLVAIKQYEAALNAGMKPEFSPDAKKKVDSYVKKQMDSNHHDKQIGVSPVVGSTVVTGAQVLERLKQANQDGLLVSLDPAAQQVLRGHIAKGATGLDYEVPLKHPYVAVMVNQLLEMGITPDLNALSKTKKLDELRQLLREESKLNAGRITFIDSGNIERDLITIKTSFEELGNPVELNPKNIVEMLKHLKDKDLPILDLKNIPAKEQVFCAQRLAQLGIHTKFDAEVPSGQPIFIRSKNINHSKKMFEDYLNQGFLPVGNKQIRLLSERALPIKIQSTDPKVIWERMRHCAQSGLVVTLNDEQIKIMKQFSEKNNPQLPIHGYSWDTVKHNIELANKLGMGIRGVTNEAQAAYLRAQAATKGNNMPRIDIVPIHKTESRFLRSDRIVDDRNRTTEFADSLFKAGINISMTGLSVMKADIENQATKTKWFGWSKTKTDNAKQAEQFLATQFAYMESKVKSLASEYNQTPAINLLAAADDLAPARPKKVKQPVAQIAPPVGEPVPLPPSVAPKIPAPLPVTRPMAVTPSSTQQRANYAVNAAGQVTPGNINVKSRLTIQSVLEEITKLQKDLKGDLDIGSIKPAEFKEASDQLYSISSLLRQAEKDLAQGKASDASNLPQYLESIKSKPDAHHKVKEFLTKLVEGPQVQQQIPPRAPRM